LNPRASACADQLRPGLGSTFTFPGGLDIHAITVHLKSGVTERDIDLRRRSWAALTDVIATEVKESKDPDVIVLGDFNSMGCHSCELPYGNQQELSDLDRQLRIGESPARRVGADIPCSQYFQQQPGLLDHVVVTEATRELSPTVRTQVEGYCQSLGCESFTGREPLALRRLSDHCPLVVELTDRDLD
jgi:endonuclease/exonuclease/phosphatase family metal-dependent hydrolase